MPKGSLLDKHAQSETTSVYTGVKVFPMLPAELSEGITSLNENEDRARRRGRVCGRCFGCSVRWKGVSRAGSQSGATGVSSVGAWLEGRGPAPEKVAANADLAAQLKLQDKAAQRMLGSRFQHGALGSGDDRNAPGDAGRKRLWILAAGEESRDIIDRRVYGRSERRGCADI